MKAIRVHQFGGPEVLQLDDSETPTAGPGQVLVRLRAIGVNPVDTYLRTGTYTFQPPLPYTPGNDGAGEVETIGDGTTRVRPGDRVYLAGALTGTYAEYALCAEHQVYPLPNALTFAQGAALGIPYGTAHRALFHRAQAAAGETVLVHGASGGVGIAALQLARAAGLTTIGTAGAEDGLALIREHGAQHALNHHDAAHLDECLAITNGKGIDIILEMLANANLGDDLSRLAPRGRVVVIGSRDTVEIDARHLMTRDADIRGMSLMNITNEERDAMHNEMRAGLESGDLNPVVSREIPLAEAATAHRDVIKSSTHGKIVLVP